MKILITGGTGFIGHLLIEASPEHEFTVVTRSIDSAKNTLAGLNQVSRVITLEEVAELDDYDAVINLAGEPIMDKRWSDSQKRLIEASRWDTTKHLVSCFEQSNKPPEVFISGSAIGYYGEQGEREITEQTATDATDFSANLCREWERIAKLTSSRTRLVILRTGIVLHPDFGALQRMLLPFKLGLGGPIGYGQHYFSWIHWHDMISAIRYLLENQQASGAFNMTAPNPVTNKVFSQSLGAAVNRPAIFPAPPFMLRIALGEGAELLTVSQRILPRALHDSGFEFTYTSIEDSLENLLGDG